MAKKTGNAPAKARLNARFFLRQILLVAFIIAFGLTFLGPSVLVIIGSGEAGVLFRPFRGGTSDHILREGTHLVAPWNDVTRYSLRVAETPRVMRVLTEDGLITTIAVSIRHLPDVTRLFTLHKEIGPDYVDEFVVPSVDSAAREVIGRYTPEALYRTDLAVIKRELLESSARQVAKSYIQIDDIEIESVSLPDSVNTAIEAKMRRQQEFQRYEHLIVAEQQEAKRRKIEAEGIKQYQERIGASLSNEFLRWQGLQVTTELAKSDNRKVLIVGASDKGGTPPVILNLGQDGARTAHVRPAVTTAAAVATSTDVSASVAPLPPPAPAPAAPPAGLAPLAAAAAATGKGVKR